MLSCHPQQPQPCAAAALLSLPGPSCPNPTLADMLAPDPLSLCNGHHPGAAPAVALHPAWDVYLIEPAAVAPVQLCFSRGASKTPIVLEAVWNCGMTVASDETQNEHVSYRADVEAGLAIQGCWQSHRAGHSSCMMLSWVRSMGSNMLKYTRDTSVWDVLYPGPLAPMGHKVMLKKSWDSWECAYHTRHWQAVPLQVKISCDVQWFH